MTPGLQLGWRGLRVLLASVGTLALWCAWLALGALFCAQLYVVSRNELALPGFLLRQIEGQLAASGLTPSFGRASLDPDGRILLENLRIAVPAFGDPVLTARSVYLRLNPWLLSLGRVEATEVRLSGVTVAVPAMLSPSGRVTEVISDLDATFSPGNHAVELRQLSGRVGRLTVSARGTLVLPAGGTGTSTASALGELIRARFTEACRRVVSLESQLEPLEDPALNLRFSSPDLRLQQVSIELLARRLRLPGTAGLEVEEPELRTRLLLPSPQRTAEVLLRAASVRASPDLRVRGLEARIRARTDLDHLASALRDVELTADSVDAEGVRVDALALRARPLPLPRVELSAVASVLGAPLALQGRVQVEERSGEVDLQGRIPPGVLDVIAARVGANVRRYFDFDSFDLPAAHVRFGPQLAFERIDARIAIPLVRAYGVNLEDARAVLALEPGRLVSPEVSARVGENFARGSYEHDLRTHQYRFLLEGRLRPLAISPWFRESWPNFFRQFDFSAAPPEATVDVRSNWRTGGQSAVFVFADVDHPGFRGTKLDRVRTRIFLRPGFYDGLEVHGEQGDAELDGRFTYVLDPATLEWRSIEFEAVSGLELRLLGDLLGPLIQRTIAPIRLQEAPWLRAVGRFTSSRAPGGPEERLRVEARTTGPFHFHHFPLRDVSLTATLNQGEISLDDIQATVASGSATGHARVWGNGDARRLGFDLALKDAHLGEAAGALEEFFSGQKGRPPSPPGRFVQEKANLRLDLAASAEGRYDDVFSYKGDGSAVLRGAEISEVPLLGLLSDLLKFTSLRFTEARGNFRIEGPRLVFPDLSIRGSNSALSARGNYALDRQQLDFAAKVYPFQESGSLLKSVVGAVLTPLSEALEVKLSGSLEKPSWEFVLGPSQLLRALGGGREKSDPPPPPAPTEPPAPATVPAPGGVPAPGRE